MKKMIFGIFLAGIISLFFTSCAPMMPKGANPKYKGIKAIEEVQKPGSTKPAPDAGAPPESTPETPPAESGSTGEQTGTPDASGGQATPSPSETPSSGN